MVATFGMDLSTAKLHLSRPKQGMVPRGSQDGGFFSVLKYENTYILEMLYRVHVWTNKVKNRAKGIINIVI